MVPFDDVIMVFINSVVSEKRDSRFENEVYKHILRIDMFSMPQEFSLMTLPQSRKWLYMVQIMDWCWKASSHYLKQCRPGFVTPYGVITLQWRHNDHDCVSNHQPRGCLRKRLFRHRSKKTSKLRVTGLCAGNSPGTGEFPAQMASNAANVSIWWRHHVSCHVLIPPRDIWWFID